MKLSKCTHTAVSIEQTQQEQRDAIVDGAPGEQLGVRCLAQGSHLSRDIEGGRALYIHSPLSFLNPVTETSFHKNVAVDLVVKLLLIALIL